MKHIRAGSLHHTITLLRPLKQTRASGDYDIVYEEVATIQASIEPITGREYWLARQAQSELTHIIVCRYTPDVATDWRITFGEKVYEIASLQVDEERQRVLTIQAIERGVTSGLRRTSDD